MDRFALFNIAAPVTKDTSAHLFVNNGKIRVIDIMNVFGDQLLAVSIGLDWAGVLVEDIDLFEGETLSFRDEEIGEDEAPQAC